jgi:1-aminocyclopropane-1-carboxylate deaminase/D-cysteine desulfhydrase-like pyridoxal-dependent ACC family enzyme
LPTSSAADRGPALIRAFPGLEPHLPRLALGDYPTPVRRLEHLSEACAPTRIWMKCDDVAGEAYGGNKVRKLEHLLAEAQSRGATRLLAAGAAGSHHVLATAVYGRRYGFEIDAVLYPQPMSQHAEGNLEAVRALVDRVTLVDRVSALPGLIETLSRHRPGRSYFVPMGGSSAVGTVGYVSAAFELKAQIDAGILPVPERIYAPLGSGGTVAGLALGLALAGVSSTVVGVRIAPRSVSNEPLVRWLMAQTRALLHGWDPSIPAGAAPRLTVEGRFLGGGYGVATAEAEAAVVAARADGIELEVTYTGKALAALLSDARGRRRPGDLLFWNTLNSRPIEPLIAR